MKLFAVVNPAAGGGRAGSKADEALDRLRAAGLDLEVRFTEREGHGTDLAADGYDGGHRHFLAVGGDGTSFEVLNGLFPAASAEEPVTLGMLPLGTGNSFLRDFRITDAESAIEALIRGKTHQCDVVRATHSEGAVHFINLLSVGFTADVTAMANRRFKRFGTAGYVMAVASCLRNLDYPLVRYRIEDGEFDGRPCVCLSFSNSRFTGGAMMMAPRADVADGKVDVVRINQMGRLRTALSFPTLFRGTHVHRAEVEVAQAAAIECEFGRRDVMIDGEILQIDVQRLEVVPDALRVIA